MRLKFTILLFFIIVLAGFSHAQSPCGGTVPTFNVNLTGNPSGIWTSPSVSRSGNCCTNSNCIYFIVTLDPGAAGLNLSVISGAAPGILQYQVNCGPAVSCGTPVCLSGVGPHKITFCKPGNNDNVYQITSIPGAVVGSDISINEGCTGTINATGFNVNTATWTSIYPGAVGAYNNYLSCTSGCQNPIVTATGVIPPYVDYQICGSPASTCNFGPMCDTVRISFPTTLLVNITPPNPIICFGQTSTTITAHGSGGTPPYTYLWNNVNPSQSLIVGNGTYTVKLSDASNCPPAYATVTVNSLNAPIQADAGNDETVCNQNPIVTLNGEIDASMQGSGSSSIYETGIWSGGAGIFSPNNTTLSASYIPTPSELAAGFVNLILTSTGNGSCPGASDTVRINYVGFSGVVAITPTPASCFGGSDGSATINVTLGTPPYTYSWNTSPAQSGANATNLGIGTYAVTVTDGLGCTSPNSVIITQPLPLNVTSSITQVSCPGGNNGSISTSPTGGTGPYTYLWQPGNQTTSSINNQLAGVYSLLEIDSKGCRKTTTFTITQPSPIAILLSQTPVSCFNGTDGIAYSAVSGGTGPYTYSWSSGATSPNAIGLHAGSVTLNVIDSKGCTKSGSITITQSTAVIASTTSTNETCSYSNNGTATASATGGSPGYTYLWQPGGLTSAIIPNLSSGIYSLTVTDLKGCTGTAFATITEPQPLTINFISQVNVSCFGGNNGAVTASPTGGTPPYTYLWSGGAITASRTNLVAGTYSVTVTDSKGCFTTSSVIITQPTLLIASITSTNEICSYANNGTATAVPSGGTPGYTYLWQPGLQTTGTLSNLSAGTYTLTITDLERCTASANTIITEPALLAISSTSQTNVSCFGGSDGAATANSSGGTPGYTYLWTPGGAVTATASNLSAGTYLVKVTDFSGCFATNSVIITQPDALLSNSTVTNETCNYLNDGTATAAPSGGTPGYTYLWQPGALTSISINNLSSGTYTLSVADSKGCITTSNPIITEPAAIAITFTGQINVTCFAGNDGAITASPAGGTPNYSYLWASGGGTTASRTNLTSGTYSVTVTDSKGCFNTNSVFITQPAPVSATTAITNETCSYLDDGTATAAASGGTPGYTYLWKPNLQTTKTISPLASGTYTLIVTDTNGCTGTTNAIIAEPAPITISFISQTNVSCNSGNDGALTARPSGGTPTYTYLWAPGGETSASLTNLSMGTYTVTVTDNAGCTGTNRVTITQPAALTVNATVTNETCNSMNDGTATAIVSGGTSAYTYLWQPGALTSAGINNLSNGTYTLTVTDSKGCLKVTNAVIAEPAPLTVSFSSQSNVSCFAGNDGIVTANPSGGTVNYTYLWAPGGNTTTTKANLTAGTYSITVTDSKGCIITNSVAITQPLAPLAVSASSLPATCYGSVNGSVSSVATDGTGPYTYSWMPGNMAGQNIPNLAAGTYTVTATDSKGCIASNPTTIAQPSQIILTSSSVNSDCGQPNGQTSISVTGGNSPYTYLWSPSGGTDATATGLVAGAYTVIVTDFTGCTETQFGNVNENFAPIASIFSVSNVKCNGGSTGSAHVGTSGGIGPFTYSWLPYGGTDSIATGLAAGSYTVTVTGNNGCKSLATTSPAITQAPPILIAVTKTSVSCFGGNDGAASAIASGGTPGFTYQWLPGGTTGLSVNNLSAATTYTIQVTDTNSCVQNTPFSIIQPFAKLSSILSSAPVSCFGGADGSLSATASGGTAPYNYNWMPGNLNGQTISNRIAGTYTITITDLKGCSLTDSVIVTQPANIVLTMDSINSNCGLPNGQASVSVIGGTGAYSYLWSPSGGTNASAIALLAGPHSVKVSDGNGCISIAGTTVNDNASPIATVSSTTNVTCYAGSNGTATVSVSVGNGPFTFSWMPPGISDSIATGLLAGSYTVTVTDVNSCQSIPAISPQITQPSPVFINLTKGAVSCFGGNNGTASAIASGGTPGYTYHWLPGGTTGLSIINLSATTYTIQVTDTNSCMQTLPFTISQPMAALSATLSFTAGSCFGGANASVSASAVGGSAPYNYSWMPGNSNGPTFSNVSTGTYTVTITDNKGCTYLDSITVTQPALIVLATDSINSTCSLANGQASVIASGGAGSYLYQWSPSGGTNAIAISLVQGVYNVKVTDANGCISTKGVTINDKPSPIASVSSTTNVSCNAGSNGTATVSVSSGAGPFTFSWMPGGITDSIATGLLPGTYTVTVTDTNLCQSIPAVSPEITQPFPILITVTKSNVTCFGGNDGTASAIASSGTPGYTYKWLPSGTVGTSIANLSANTYTIQVTDTNSCVQSLQTVITEPNQLNLVFSSVSNVKCLGGNDGTATATVSGGTVGYTYNWLPIGGNGPSGTGLSAGTYTLTVNDFNNCLYEDSVVITQPSQGLSANGTGFSTSCFGGSNGTAGINTIGGTPGYSYLWTPNVSVNDTASGLSAGNYAILVTDNKGCEANVSVSIAQPPELNGSLVSVNPSCGLSNGSITSQLSGGIFPYTFLWSFGASTTSGISGLGSGTYNLLVTDANGCTLSLSANLSITPSPTISVSSINNVSCFGGNDGSATINITQGTAPYAINWSPSGGNNLTASVLSAGTYIINVIDAIGCQTFDSLIIAEPSPLDVSISSMNDVLCNGGNTGNITVAAMGGTGPLYTYSWVPAGSNTPTATNLTIGTYTVNVTDQNNCSKSISATISEPALLAVSIDTIIDATCYGGTGSATLIASGGILPYSYSWSAPAVGQTGSAANNLVAGNYTVIVTDTNGCFTNINMIVKQPLEVITQAGGNDTLCFGQTGNISATALGGAGNYYYAWQPSGAITSGTLPITPATSTTYTVVAFDQTGCPGTPSTVTAIVYNLTAANVQTIGTSPICPGQNSTIYVQTTGTTGPLTYQWNNNLGTEPGAFLVTLSQPTTYIVTVSNSCGLSVTDSVTVLFNPQPTLSLTSDTNSLCVPGTMPFFDNSLTGNLNDPITMWDWNFGDGTSSTVEDPVHSYNNPGIYMVTLTVSTTGGCTSNNLSTPLIITAYPIPTAAFSENSTNLNLPFDELILNNQSIGANTYNWNFGDGGTSTQFNPHYFYTLIGVFQVQLISMSQFGCIDTAFAEITTNADVIFPNVFTPNPDGAPGGSYDINNLNNDIFFPYTSGVIEYKLEIFNRWGEEIFESLDVQQGWDGYYKGALCQEDVYIWKAYIKLNNGKIFNKSGDVTLLKH